MSEWDWTPAGDVATQRKDVVQLVDGVEYRTMGVRWYGKGAYDRGTGTTETIKAKRLYRASAGDFVFNRIDTQKGAFDVVPADLDGALATNEFPLYVTDPSRLLAGFLLLYFSQESVLRAIENTRAGSEGRARWKEADFEAWLVPIPPLAKQYRIITVMSAVDAQIEALDAESVQADLLYRAALSVLIDKYDSRSIESVLMRSAAGGTPPRENSSFFGGDIPWIKSGEVENDAITTSAEFITAAGLDNSSAKWVEAGSTLVAMYGQGDTKGTAGFVLSPVTTNQAVLALVPNRELIDQRYLLHAVRSRTESLRGRAVGAAQPNLNKAVVMSEPIPVPADLNVQRQEASALDSILEYGRALNAELTSLRRVRADLLSALLSQEITVDEAVDQFVEGAA
ncbi:hypothetical protein NJB1604_18670 [Mycobacterium marinum]|uniref:restriction endonuclease subunit S n=1 Tax=Mycobacterium marinum TaxID=1781 RepID=UPI0021C33231|nr:restriction endonuclease subunit S [Mycobacterium marinum]GJO43290.1 hypothetical protein NJB1604_18670 [Mycobacterium marinum]